VDGPLPLFQLLLEGVVVVEAFTVIDGALREHRAQNLGRVERVPGFGWMAQYDQVDFVF
jgi:hypothetical protein